MASAIEALGMSLPYSSSSPANDAKKEEECLATGIKSCMYMIYIYICMY